MIDELLHNPFDKDLLLNGGYYYTTNARISSRLANDRLTKATLDIVDLSGKSVIDVGCGDGLYTYELLNRGNPKRIFGLDVAKRAIDVAKKKFGGKKGIQFDCGDIYHLSKTGKHFDLAVIRGVIHHVERPDEAISSVASVCNEMVIIEPNGYNVVLKIIERISLYHRVHREKSYVPFRICQWLKDAGFEVIRDGFAGLVPFFCPDKLAYWLKAMEPVAESFPYVRNGICAVYVVLARKKEIEGEIKYNGASYLQSL